MFYEVRLREIEKLESSRWKEIYTIPRYFTLIYYLQRRMIIKME